MVFVHAWLIVNVCLTDSVCVCVYIHTPAVVLLSPWIYEAVRKPGLESHTAPVPGHLGPFVTTVGPLWIHCGAIGAM